MVRIPLPLLANSLQEIRGIKVSDPLFVREVKLIVTAKDAAFDLAESNSELQSEFILSLIEEVSHWSNTATGTQLLEIAAQMTPEQKLSVIEFAKSVIEYFE